MSQYTAFATNCEISRDPDENTRRHQAMIDEVNELVGADGWRGVKVTHFATFSGHTVLQVEPGISPLTLDYLRKMKTAANTNTPEQSAPASNGD
ncbi:hypothetical protein [Agrobacterium tumefaciens]|uniref:hypothetical protein n=1 Tax=Agrobacterium tumefaciens TaxID=358 RepID=UPI003BA15C98